MKMKERLDKKSYYLSIAREVAARSTCIRRQYGAVIVREDEIISTGYNGAPRGEANCCDTGECWREAHNIPHGQQYEKCVAVHAEMNAIISAARRDMIGGTLYLVGFDGDTPIRAEPCEICRRLIKNAGIGAVVVRDPEIQSFKENIECREKTADDAISSLLAKMTSDYPTGAPPVDADNVPTGLKQKQREILGETQRCVCSQRERKMDGGLT